MRTYGFILLRWGQRERFNGAAVCFARVWRHEWRRTFAWRRRLHANRNPSRPYRWQIRTNYDLNPGHSLKFKALSHAHWIDQGQRTKEREENPQIVDVVIEINFQITVFCRIFQVHISFAWNCGVIISVPLLWLLGIPASAELIIPREWFCSIKINNNWNPPTFHY